MSCQRGCDDGWIYVGDAARACECRHNRANSEFGGDYAPGGLSTRAKRRQLARRNGQRGGWASAVKRRQLARGCRPKARSRAQALSLGYGHRQLTRSKFDARYEALWPRPERGTAAVSWEKGRRTLWEHYRSVFTLYRVAGQHARTTNDQRAVALSSRGIDRGHRTMQRANRKLGELGLAQVSHYKDQGARAGHKDCLVVEIRTPSILHVTPPLRGSTNPPKGREVGTADPVGKSSPSASEALIPPASPAMPPDGGDQQLAAPPPSTERQEIEAALAFRQLQLDCGWDSPRLRADLQWFRVRLRLCQEGRGHASP